MYNFFCLGNPSGYELQVVYGLSLWVQVKLHVLGWWLPSAGMQIVAWEQKSLDLCWALSFAARDVAPFSRSTRMPLQMAFPCDSLFLFLYAFVQIPASAKYTEKDIKLQILSKGYRYLPLMLLWLNKFISVCFSSKPKWV